MTALLEVRSVSRSFGGLKALQNVSFTVAAGEIFGIIGPNGAGKTTLFNCLSGALRPSQGEILFDGRQIHGMRPHLSCRLGLVRTFQIVKPFRGMTVLENVKVGAFARHARADAAETAAVSVLQKLGMSELADIDADELNVAQMRKLEIARALATAPKLLLLDEMLAGLTATETQAMCDEIRRLPQLGITVILVEHSIPIVSALCARSVVLNFGEVMTCGATQDVLEDERVREAYLGSVEP